MLRRQFTRIYRNQPGGQFGGLAAKPHDQLEGESALVADPKSQQLRPAVQAGGSGGQLAIELALESKRAK